MKIEYLKGPHKGRVLDRDPERAKALIKAKVAKEFKQETETKELKTEVETKKKK